MSYTFNHETREVTLSLTLNEWDVLQCFKHAALPFMTPMKPNGDLEHLYQDLNRINHQLTINRINNN
jgi:hypothetical protein